MRGLQSPFLGRKNKMQNNNNNNSNNKIKETKKIPLYVRDKNYWSRGLAVGNLGTYQIY